MNYNQHYLVISLVGSQKKNGYDCGMFVIKYADKQKVIKFQL